MMEVSPNSVDHSPLLQEAIRCQQNRRKQSKRIHKKTKLLTEVYKAHKAVTPKAFNLNNVLKNCHLPEALSDWLMTKRTTGISSINSLLTLAAKAMSSQPIPLSEVSCYCSRQESMTQQLLNLSLKTAERKEPRNRNRKLHLEKTI